MKTQTAPGVDRSPENSTPAERCLHRLVRRVFLWPRNDTNRRHAFPWWMIAWRAPFIFACIASLYTCAAVCAMLTLAYNPSRAGDIFDRIRSA